ncbi:MAG TPA: hypothetical protein VKD70_00410 [Candidatus Acidoferrum sp.]|nr:hypothetical protein [Candidatus Acidoferrum sp.]
MTGPDGNDNSVDRVGDSVGTLNVHIVAAGQNALRAVGAEFDEFFLEDEAFYFEDAGRNVEIIVVAALFASQNKQGPRAERAFLTWMLP